MQNKHSANNTIEVIHKIVTQKRQMPTFHYHNRYEIYYVVQGGQQYITDFGIYDLSAGDMILVNSNALHRTQSITDNIESYLIYSDVSAIESCGKNAELFRKIFNFGSTVISFSGEDKNYIDMLISKMHAEYHQTSEFSEQLLKNYLYELLAISYQKNVVADKENRSNYSENTKLTNEIYAALDFIQNNYKSNITLEDVAKHVNMSVTYFSKLFKKSTGIGFAKYLLSFKLKEAVVLLQTTSMSITDIALNTGFNSSQYFCKAFKIQCGTSPFQFRNDFYNREFPDISVK